MCSKTVLCSHENNKRYPILFLQLFGFMPVSGIFQGDIEKLKFCWLSFRTFYSLLTIFGLIFITGVELFRLTVCQINIAEMQRMFLLVRSVLCAVLLIHLARKWNEFIKGCCVLDYFMVSYGSPKLLEKKIWIALISFSLAFVGK